MTDQYTHESLAKMLEAGELSQIEHDYACERLTMNGLNAAAEQNILQIGALSNVLLEILDAINLSSQKIDAILIRCGQEKH